MAKRARAGELRTLVYFRRAVRRVDGEGYPLTEREEPVFGLDGAGQERPVHCKWVNAHGAEVFSAMQLQLREPATLTMRYSPKIDSTLLVYRRGGPPPPPIVRGGNGGGRGKGVGGEGPPEGGGR